MSPEGQQPAISAEVAPSGATRVEVVQVVTKSDLETAKNDLRREMRLWLGVGSALGTTLAGVIGAVLGGGGAVAPAVQSTLQALPF